MRQTILIVEDEDLVRSLAEEILADCGFRILSAAGADEALEVSAAEPAAIDLLLTDIVMPGTSGADLAQLLMRRHPELRVLYISGFSDDLALRADARNERSAFLQKPFTAELLERRVRTLLGD